MEGISISSPCLRVGRKGFNRALHLRIRFLGAVCKKKRADTCVNIHILLGPQAEQCIGNPATQLVFLETKIAFPKPSMDSLSVRVEPLPEREGLESFLQFV